MMKLLEIYTVSELFERIKKDKKIAELLGEDCYNRLCENADLDVLQKNYDELYKYGVKFLAYCDAEFPEKLRQREVCPPPGLYYKGDLGLIRADKTAVAIVGTRRCSHYGKECAFKFGSELIDYGFVVISGLATGIDAYAHDAALRAGGKTVAVLGMGHAKFSPVDNIKLYEHVCREGLVVSEYPPLFEATKYTFPERNRIISGLSDAVIIVEAAAKSGALITADRALEQGREIFAVPGNITGPKSAGTNALIKSGASLLAGTQDILTCFSVKNSKNHKNIPVIQLDIYEQTLYNHLANGELTLDELQSKTDFTVPELLAMLLSMEMKGAAVRLPNNKYRVLVNIE
jgi:DNA processing protein